MASEKLIDSATQHVNDSSSVGLIVLDTNVALDAFLFERDPSLEPLRRAVRDGWVQPIATPWAADEFRNIMKLDKIPADAERRERAMQRFTQATRIVPLPPKQSPTPKCADRDDQEFIDLAVALQAPWLLSRDRKVLKLNRRFIKLELPTRIMQPVTWCETVGAQLVNR